jgi:predicted extracellular nuclease
MKIPFFNRAESDPSIITIAFYNVENLFDPIDDIEKFDDDFLPMSEKKWTNKRYKKKIYKLGTAISQIGEKRSGKAPIIVGLAEVENKNVLNELIESKHLREHDYGYVHYESPDERGIDVALMYQKNSFKVIDSKPYSIDITVDEADPDYTRDILLVVGEIHGEQVHIIVNHWSSRRGGPKETEYKRLIASEKVIEIVNEIRESRPEAKVIVMGDFNDDPSCKSVRQLSNSLDLHNPMETLLSYTRGSLNYKFQWNIFDQIMISTNFLEFEKGSLSFSKGDIFDEKFLMQYKGKFKGQPFRTYVGTKYKGGYSDHFPVFIQLKKH